MRTIQETLQQCKSLWYFPENQTGLGFGMAKIKRPLSEQGNRLKAARGGRTLKEVAADSGVSIQRLQNWERGVNAPKRDLWPKLKDVLGIDLAALYGASDGAVSPPGGVVNPKAVLPLIRDIKTKLDLLEKMCSEPVADRKLEKNGYTHPGKVKLEYRGKRKVPA